MASITEIRNRMRSIQQTLKITNAMYLISSAKVKKARKQLSEVETYLSHKNDATLFLIGQMGRHYFEKKNIPIDGEFMYTAQDPTISRAKEISNTLLDLYEQGALDEIYLVFTRSYSAMHMEPEIIKLLPLDRAMLSARRGMTQADQYRDIVRYEPSPEAVLDVLVPGVIKGYLFSALVESFCSEQNARMTAMDSASDSAREMLKSLSLEFNRARQGAITQEITEIAGGAEALSQQ